MDPINLMILLSTEVFEAANSESTGSSSVESSVISSGDEENDLVDLQVEKKRRRKRGR